ncbi:MAG: 4Fe-4S binding protein [Erysipelotrichaceae bacterium]|nr:4Fe-4S binding protein [Erysipelotrichaceae bacterium]MDY5252011.1 [Fe-Fe] hydrogenase large subunit C-terminal domain-containing protein [Erysipelotrichaceae bacterium]
MMKYIRLKEANCRNCLRCVRVCPTKAMSYINHQPTISEDECILCGECYKVCPHSAKKIISNLQMIKSWIAEGKQVIVSVAPSFVAVWPNFKWLKASLLAKGFYDVEETALGAALVTQEYNRLVQENKMRNIITTCCPTVVSLVEKEYGELVDCLAPVVSPMVAHGLDIKKRYPQAKVVFISPCIAKEKEANDPRFDQAVDATLNVEEVVKWIGNDPDINADWESIDQPIARLYPITGGILKTMEDNDNYKRVNIEGIKRIKECLEALKSGMLEGYFFEMSACEGSCVNGPLLAHFKHNEWLGQSLIRDNVDKALPIAMCQKDEKLGAKWQQEEIYRPSYSDEQIQDILNLMGKNTKNREFNCGACGYETCRDKAIAVLAGKADPKLCMPYALEHAQSVSNTIIKNTPNGIIVIDSNNLIKEINPAAMYMLHLDRINPIGMPIEAILNKEDFAKIVKEYKKSSETQYFRAYYEEYGKTFDHAIMRLADEDYYVVILMDLTVQETKEKIMRKMQASTIEITQQVIDEQMRTVQEIASLLGETTARSKVALSKLKKAMEDEA